MADINGDGWLDIYVCNAGNMHDPELRKNQLFINNHNLTFTDSAEQYGLAEDGYSTQASFLTMTEMATWIVSLLIIALFPLTV
mgnify:CR=1 FL=1